LVDKKASAAPICTPARAALHQRLDERIGEDPEAVDVGANPLRPIDDHDRRGKAGGVQLRVVLDVPLGLHRQPPEISDDDIRLRPVDLGPGRREPAGGPDREVPVDEVRCHEPSVRPGPACNLFV
jgi:hypothetical protein